MHLGRRPVIKLKGVQAWKVGGAAMANAGHTDGREAQPRHNLDAQSVHQQLQPTLPHTLRHAVRSHCSTQHWGGPCTLLPRAVSATADCKRCIQGDATTHQCLAHGCEPSGAHPRIPEHRAGQGCQQLTHGALTGQEGCLHASHLRIAAFIHQDTHPTDNWLKVVRACSLGQWGVMCAALTTAPPCIRGGYNRGMLQEGNAPEP